MLPSNNHANAHAPLMQRRKALALLGMGGFAAASQLEVHAAAQEQKSESADVIKTVATVSQMVNDPTLQPGWFVLTLGHGAAGDGGSALYQISDPVDGRPANGGDVLTLGNGKQAVMLPGEAVNYHMFGIKGDRQNDDGVAIKLAHAFAHQHRLPVIHPAGEYWIHDTHEILITTNVEWGNTIFHINEKHNKQGVARFLIRGLQPAQSIELDENQKAAFLQSLKPGVAVIPEMAPYKNCLVTVADANDRIGFRAGESYQGQSWAREELFYVEEDGRIVGDIAWTFKDYTALTASPCSDSYLTIQGGGFYLSGDIPGDTFKGYFSNGFSIQRSRTVIRDQWMGLEPGNQDISIQSRSGFYSFSRVFDVTLENIRLIPWEQNRSDPSRVVQSGTYGISGARMLNCTFRNLTAEGTLLHWGVFGTNLNKNFRVENSRLNRVDVHFHCWNLTIQNSVIGMRGISITGGGQLVLENTTVHGTSMVNFRHDFGSKWDGDIRIRNCRIVAVRDRPISVLSSHPAKFAYGYPIGCGRAIDIENLVIDFSQFPQSKSTVWLMSVAPFSLGAEDEPHFFPHSFTARNVTVQGRKQGVRLVDVHDPYHYQLPQEGSYDGDRILTNCQMVFENISLEEIPESVSGTAQTAHLRLGNRSTDAYGKGRGVYPHIRISDCRQLCLYLGGSAAEVIVSDSTIDRLTAAVRGPLRGLLALSNCQFTPRVTQGSEPIYALEAELGTHLTNCTVHPPLVEGTATPAAFDRVEFVQINKLVRYYQLNTAISNRMLAYLKEQQIDLDPAFIAMLKSHHALESETV